MPLVSTDIQGVSSPHARKILDTCKTLGIRYYRLGFWNHRPGLPPKELHARIASSLKELAALNRELGLCALFQNHSSPDPKTAIVGGDLAELYRIVKDFPPDQIAVAFDPGHAIIAHGDQWRSHFDKLKKHIRVVYVKDMQRPSQFVPFGQGELGRTNFFHLLAEMKYDAPLCMHIEYDWAGDGKKTPAILVETLKHNRRVLGQWWRGKPA
jgi:sugar phosphate isomerase/epimerase